MVFAQTKVPVKKKAMTAQKTVSQVVKPVLDVAKINDSIPALIPQKKDGKYGFINQKGKVIIPHQYSNVGFFYEDCTLLNSPNKTLKKFGSGKYASVRLGEDDFRIDQAGKRVYKYKTGDLGKCPPEFKKQLFHSYIQNGYYGIIEDSKFENAADYRQYQIYPQYQYLHIMEGDDVENPMIVASYNDLFGVIDKNNRVIIPFEYADIKRNLSWKIGRLFEVTKDNRNYFFVDDKNHRY